MKRPTARELIGGKRVLAIAHRGDSSQAPENTLPAFRSALALGVDFVELDYRHSSDGVPVVFHDRDLDRTTDASARWHGQRIALAEHTAEELRTLDAGRWFAPKFAGTQLSTLAEALAAITPQAMAAIERKTGDAATCVKLLRDGDWVDHVAVMAFDWDFLADCHAREPKLATIALGDEQLTPAKLEAARRTGCVAIGWNNDYLTAQGVQAIHARGWKAWVWTADQPARWRELVEMGVSGITSNRPGPLKEMLATLDQQPSSD